MSAAGYVHVTCCDFIATSDGTEQSRAHALTEKYLVICGFSLGLMKEMRYCPL